MTSIAQMSEAYEHQKTEIETLREQLKKMHAASDKRDDEIIEEAQADLQAKLAAANERTNVHVAECVRLVGELAEAEVGLEALSAKLGPNCCACSYDKVEDVCMTHSPMLNAAKAERDRLRDVIAAFFNCGQTGYIPQPVRDKMLDALNPTPPEAVAARDAANESEVKDG